MNHCVFPCSGPWILKIAKAKLPKLKKRKKVLRRLHHLVLRQKKVEKRRLVVSASVYEDVEFLSL